MSGRRPREGSKRRRSYAGWRADWKRKNETVLRTSRWEASAPEARGAGAQSSSWSGLLACLSTASLTIFSSLPDLPSALTSATMAGM